MNIQNVPGGKVSILEGHSIGHSKQKIYMYMCPVPYGFRNRAISLCSSKITEILCTVSNTSIYCSSDKSWYSLPSIIHFQKFHRQHQCTLQLV
jgi:hypothetical protein